MIAIPLLSFLLQLLQCVQTDRHCIFMCLQLFADSHFFDGRSDGLYPFSLDFLKRNFTDKTVQTDTAIRPGIAIGGLSVVGAGCIITGTFGSKRT